MDSVEEEIESILYICREVSGQLEAMTGEGQTVVDLNQ